jgi:hypothetical protein
MDAVIQKLSSQELLAYIVDTKWEYLYNRKLKKIINRVKFRYSAQIKEINFSVKCNFDKDCLLAFSECLSIEKK